MLGLASGILGLGHILDISKKANDPTKGLKLKNRNDLRNSNNYRISSKFNSNDRLPSGAIQNTSPVSYPDIIPDNEPDTQPQPQPQPQFIPTTGPQPQPQFITANTEITEITEIISNRNQFKQNQFKQNQFNMDNYIPTNGDFSSLKLLPSKLSYNNEMIVRMSMKH